MRCPHCKNRLLQRVGSTIRLRTDGVHVFDAEGKCRAACHWCGAQVEVPIQLAPGIEIVTERLFVPSTTK